MNDLPHLSPTETQILKMLTQQPRAMYGLELVKVSGGRLKRGTIYVTLGRMEDKGYIESRKEDPWPGTRGMPRRMYRLTGYGQRVLAAWEAAAERFAMGLA